MSCSINRKLSETLFKTNYLNDIVNRITYSRIHKYLRNYN